MSNKHPNNPEENFTIHVVHIGENTNEKERNDNMNNKEKDLNKYLDEMKNFQNPALQDFAKFLDRQFGDSHFTEALNKLNDLQAADNKKETKDKKVGNSVHSTSTSETKESCNNNQDELTYSEEALDAIHDVLANISYQLDQIIKRMDKDTCPIEPGMFGYIDTEELQADNINIDAYIKRRVKKEVRKQLDKYVQKKSIRPSETEQFLQTLKAKTESMDTKNK